MEAIAQPTLPFQAELPVTRRIIPQFP